MNEYLSPTSDPYEALRRQVLAEAQRQTSSNVPSPDQLLQLLTARGALVVGALSDQRGGQTFRSDAINMFYRSVYLDLVALYLGAQRLEAGRDALWRHLEDLRGGSDRELYDAFNQLNRLIFLRQRPNYFDATVESFVSPRPMNVASPVMFDAQMGVARLPITSSRLAEPTTYEARAPGSPLEKSTAGFELAKALDAVADTGWNVSYLYMERQQPTYNLTLDQLVVAPDLMLKANVVRGGSVVQLTAQVAVGMELTIGGAGPYTVVSINGQNVVLDHVLSADFAAGTPVTPTGETNLANGALCDLRFKFDHEQMVSHVRLTPMAERPMRVAGLAYRATGQTRWTEIKIGRQPTTMDVTGLDFETVMCDELRIVLEQQSERLISTSSSQLDQTVIELRRRSLDNLLNGQARLAALGSAPAREASAYRSAVSNYGKSLARLSASSSAQVGTSDQLNNFLSPVIDALSTISPTAGSSMTSVGGLLTRGPANPVRNYYMYEFGLYELALFNNRYAPLGEYRSEELAVGLDVTKVRIEVDEVHPISDLGVQHTSVDYGVLLSDGQELAVPNARIKNSVGRPWVEAEQLDFRPIVWENGVPIQLEDGSWSDVGALLRHRTDSVPTVIEVHGSSVRALHSGELDFITMPDGHQMVTVATPDPLTSDGTLRRGARPAAIYVANYAPESADVAVGSLLLPTMIGDWLEFETDDQFMATLDLTPHVSPLIVNDPRWRRSLTNSTWTWSGVGFTVIDNVYYGPKVEADQAFVRTPAVVAQLTSLFGEQGLNAKICVDRFLNKYARRALDEQRTYEPIIVEIDGRLATNISRYASSQLPSFTSSDQDPYQYYQLGNVLQFNKKVKGKVRFAYLDGRLRTVMRLRAGRKTSPALSPTVDSMITAVGRRVL